MSPFPVERAHQLEDRPVEQDWLVEGLWADNAVGTIGGEPKTCKSYLALSLAVAVASGKPCLDRYPVRHPGRVLIYAAEDALHVVRSRLEGLARRQALKLSELDIWVITAPAVRIDLQQDRIALSETLENLRPVLLMLDPFVRLHRVQENQSAEIVPLLAYLRNLQRYFSCSVAIVHHARKGSDGTRAGQALRGSGEFHAWLDSGLYLRRKGSRLTLTTEHRAHPSLPDVPLELDDTADRMGLRIIETSPDTPPPTDSRERLMQALREAQSPLSLRQLQPMCGMRTSNLGALLKQLADQRVIERTDQGWQLPRTEPSPVPLFPSTVSLSDAPGNALRETPQRPDSQGSREADETAPVHSAPVHLNEGILCRDGG